MLNFIGIGVARSGTTWTATNLKRHPDIFIPVKEAYYFIYPYYSEVLSAMSAKMPDTKSLFGEWTPAYFCRSDQYVERIREHNPNMKIMLNLRNPVDRAWSWFNLRIRNKKIPSDANFMRLFKRKYKFNNYRSPGHYTKYISQWFNAFPRSQFHISIFDQMVTKPVHHLNNICRFLGVKAHYHPNNLSLNQNSTGKREMPTHIRRYLNSYYAEHIQEVKEFLHLDVNW
jgi:Sulfotransferase domain